MGVITKTTSSKCIQKGEVTYAYYTGYWITDLDNPDTECLHDAL